MAISKVDLLELKDNLKTVEGMYPEIDKPWNKYYSGIYTGNSSGKTVYQEVHDNNLDQPKEMALEFFLSKISFGDLDKNTMLASKSLEEYDVKKGDFVTIIAAGIPETVYSFYGLSKLGAVSNLMSPYFDEDQLIRRINECDSKTLIIMDKFYSMLRESIKKTGIKNVVVVPTLNSSILRFIPDKNKVKLEKGDISWNQFIKDGKYRQDTNTVQYEKDLPLAMVYSSGSTGASKGILLSNDSFQNSVYSYRQSGVEIHRGFKFYQIIPPWFSTGLATSIHLPLASGSAVFMDPRFERDIFIKNFINHKPNYSVAPTSMYEGFLDENLVKNKDLSHILYPYEGGEPLKKEVSDKVEKVFRDHNCDAKLLVGYGQCECGATITTETPFTSHVDGNVGIPLPGINLRIVDDDMNMLPYNMRGQILVDTPCGMLGYYKNDIANKEYFHYDEDGTKWYCTGDIGHIDEDGNLYISGRASDFSKVNDKKVYNFDIENLIMKDKDIKLCDVITNNGLLTAHLVFNDEFKNIADQDMINEKLSQLQQLIYDGMHDIDFVPYQFKLRDSFPYAKSGKRNVLEMLKETEGFITVDKFNANIKKLCR